MTESEAIHRDLSQYTTIDRDQHEVAKGVIARTLSNEAVGRENIISSDELAERVTDALPPDDHMGASAVRDLIPMVRLEYRLPIGNANGYFVIDSQAEATRQIERQRKQSHTSLQRARDIAAAWNQVQYDG